MCARVCVVAGTDALSRWRREVQSMHAEEMVHNMFESLEAVRIAAPGPLFCNQCCLQRQQQWCVAASAAAAQPVVLVVTRLRLHTCTSLATSQ
jgi:hypothetical protein